MTRSRPAPPCPPRATRRWSSSSRPVTTAPARTRWAAPAPRRTSSPRAPPRTCSAFGGADQCGIDGHRRRQRHATSSAFSSRGPTVGRPQEAGHHGPRHARVRRRGARRRAPPTRRPGTRPGAQLLRRHGRVRRPGHQQLLAAGPAVVHGLLRVPRTPPPPSPAARRWCASTSSTRASPPPSAAMTKAFLMNSTRYMTGTGANDNLWSNNQGMGLMDLGMAFDGVPRLLDDQNPANLFTATGQTRTFTGVGGRPHQAVPRHPGVDGRAGLHHRQRLEEQPGPDRHGGRQHLQGQRLHRRQLRRRAARRTPPTTWRACSCPRAPLAPSPSR